MDKLLSSIRSFALEEDGSQVIEYALIIAVVSIALRATTSAITGTNFSGFIARINTCLTTNACV